MSLTREHRQEDLSSAYISSVAAKAGYNCGRPSGHDYGIDLEIGDVEQIGKRRVDVGRRLHIQAKASHNFINSNDDNCIHYDLKIGTYNTLILEDRANPAILILYCMPSDEDDWLSVYEECTTLRHCGYWMSLRGMPASTNRVTQGIKIPKEQMFTDSSLKSIMDRIKGGELP
ncbi:MAG: DUF4365 domain-containing protein [Methanosarcinales archaeon]|nr:MAG: DUF4365 domain-containing protein [Methanosarcinales archaeon]